MDAREGRGRAAGGRGGDAPDAAAAVELSVVIAARPATVWRCVTRSDLLSRWLSATVALDARAGGAVTIDFARHGVVVEGVVEELRPSAALVFTWGVAAGPQKDAMPPGSTRVRILLEEVPGGTRVTLRHEGLPSEKDRRDHGLGWSGYLGGLASVAPLAAIAEDVGGTAESLSDAWFAAWAETDAARRDAAIARCATDDVRFVDVHTDVRGRAALSQWMATCQGFFPGVKVVRNGAVRCTRGVLLADWDVVTQDGKVAGGGTNCSRLSLDGRLAEVVAFWRP